MVCRRVALPGAVLAVVYHAAAQGTNATCMLQYNWMNNSRGQNPCLVAAFLDSACLANPTDAYVHSLLEGYHYRPPTAHTATPCKCNTVFYAMVSACAACQGRESPSWSSWKADCPTVYTNMWPEKIPAGTSIPAWAFLDVVTPNAFDISGAQALEGVPEYTSSTSSHPSAAAKSGSSIYVPEPPPIPSTATTNAALPAIIATWSDNNVYHKRAYETPDSAIPGALIGGFATLGVLLCLGGSLKLLRAKESPPQSHSPHEIVTPSANDIGHLPQPDVAPESPSHATHLDAQPQLHESRPAPGDIIISNTDADCLSHHPVPVPSVSIPLLPTRSNDEAQTGSSSGLLLHENPDPNASHYDITPSFRRD